MEELAAWQQEAAEIEASMSRPAREQMYVEMLAGLGGVEDARLVDLALKAQELITEERDADLREYVENRIDEVYYERRRRA